MQKAFEAPKRPQNCPACGSSRLTFKGKEMHCKACGYANSRPAPGDEPRIEFRTARFKVNK